MHKALTLFGFLGLSVIFSNNSNATTIEDCLSLANIGGKAVEVRTSGGSLSQLLSALSTINGGDKQRIEFAKGIAIAVYGDNSITTFSEGYNIVFDSCKAKL